MPTTSKPKKKGNYEVALDELNVHVHILIQKFGCFEYAPYRTSFDPENKYLMHHGIDIDKATKDDISIDNSSQSEIKFCQSEKENRFASFMESESEKSYAEDSNFTKSQTELSLNNSLNTGEGPQSLFFKERKSTDSVLSEKETDEMEKSNEQNIVTEQNKSEEKKTDTEKTSSSKEPEKISDSDQLRKLELALERIKGYVSLNDDIGKESGEVESEEKEDEEIEENEKTVSKEVRKNDTEAAPKASPLFKKMITLPDIKSSTPKETVEDFNVPLQTAKNTDSFFQKLNQTIESCKAKLGISEINDDISSDESRGDENVSKSDDDDDDDDDNSSVSEAEEEASDEDEEVENIEISDEEVEDEEDGENKLEDKDESDESDNEGSESGDESNSQSSDTDIECISGGSPKKAEKPSVSNNIDYANKLKISENEDNIKEMSVDSSEAIITNPDMQMPEVTIEDSGSLQILGENSSSRSSNEVKENAGSLPTKQCSEVKTSQSVISPKKDNMNLTCTNSSSNMGKNSNLNVNNVEIHDRISPENNSNAPQEKQTVTNYANSSSPSKMSSLSKIEERLDGMNHDMSMNKNYHIPNAGNSPAHCKNETEEEDDDIFICTPTRPKSPPIIVLDDDPENEDSCVSDTFAVKTPPYSTSAESLSNDENPIAKTNSGDEHDNEPEQTVSFNDGVSKESVLDKRSQLNGKIRNMSTDSRTSETESPIESRKRKLSTNSSCSEDDVQIVTPVKNAPLTGAIRTFNKPNNSNARSLKPATPTMETVKRNLEKESLNQINKSPIPGANKSPISSESSEMESNIASQDQTPVSQNSESLFNIPALNSSIIDVSKLTDKDKEILLLRSKLNCIMTAYKIQTWKCNQEREELRHNMNLILMEMRTSLESDKKQAIETLGRKFEQEKQKSIEETKRKQWCANCLMESRYACCWNTSYCSIDCQKRHFPEHRNLCTQVKNKNEIAEGNQKSVASKPHESNEKKKVFIVNAQQIPISKSIQIMPAKNALQINTSTNSNSNIQFLLPVKSPAEPTSASSSTLVSAPAPTTSSNETNTKEQNLDSAQIISQVRNKVCDLGTAISLLTKKNMESSLAVVKKKEVKEKKEKSKEPPSLEDIYNPLPPKVTFEGYESASPDPNLVIVNNDEEKDSCDEESQGSEHSKHEPEPDLVLSDTDDKDNEMVHIGYGVDVKAKFLNKCLIYGQTAKKLTRCLMDIIFPDVKLLANCSALGLKSNVTKLTRAALPTRKVQAIVDFVSKRYPAATRSEIVLAINMKCKEARVILNKREHNKPRKALAVRRLLAREKESELNAIVTTAPASVTTATTTTTTALALPSPITAPLSVATTSQNIAAPIKTSPNVVCVKRSKQLPLPFNMSNKSTVPNILRCGSQILIRPKPMMNTIGNAAILQAPPPQKSETVKKMLANKRNLSMGNLSKDGKKLIMALDPRKSSTTSTQPVTVCSTSAANTRPFIVFGSSSSSVQVAKSSPSVQNPPLPVPSQVKK